jgi:hypothetical protein
MAELLGVNHTLAYSDEPSQKVDANQAGGVRRAHYDSYTFSAVLGIGDTILMGKIPKGARVVDARLTHPVDTGAIGIVKVGWAAGANGDEAADDNGLFAAAEGDFGAAALDSKMLSTAAGYQKTFAEEVNIVIECTEASTGDAVAMELEVEYVIN